MAANRLTRDQILNRALDNVDSPSLDQKDRPGGVIVNTALCISWLQEGLDFFHARFPIGGTLKTTTITFQAGTESYTLPDDFILDYEDGLVHADDQGRCQRKGFSKLLNVAVGTNQQGKPAWYAITGAQLRVRPVPSAQWSGKTATLYYYGLPAILAAGDKPTFPSDLVLVRYVYLRGLEWTRSVPPGTAETYAVGVIADLQRQGISNEQESDAVPFDRSAFPGSRSDSDPNAWMGSPVVS